jgi:IrrE N-terminal-like domain
MPGAYDDPRAHELRARFHAVYGGAELPVPVERIAEDLLALRVEQSDTIEVSGMLLPVERRIVLNAAEALHEDKPIRRQRFTIAHEIGHWVCHCLEGKAPHLEPSYCRPVDMTTAAERALEREANVFAAELLMPEAAVRAMWAATADVAAVADGLGVSPLAAQWRLYGFGLAEAPADVS